MSPAPDHRRYADWSGRLLPGNDQAILLAEAFRVTAGDVLHLVERLLILGSGHHDQGAGLHGQRGGTAEHQVSTVPTGDSATSMLLPK
jgi:hypothetical protein